MGMSTHVYGVIPGTNERFQSMLRIYNECEGAGVVIPLEVLDFFDHEKPDPAGVIVSLEESATKYYEDYGDGFEVDISKLPKDVKIIRFVNRC